jgi:hypothetical protein
MPGGKRLILHVGLRKCASTSMQAVLDGVAPCVSETCLILSRPLALKAWREGVFRYMRAASEDAPGLKRAMLQTVTEEATRLRATLDVAPQPVVVLSDENLFGARAFAHGETLFDWALEVLPIVLDAFAGWTVRIVLYHRPEGPWLRSCYNQEVKNNGVTESFEAWLTRKPEHLSVAAGVAALEARFPDCVVALPIGPEDGPPGASILREAGIREEIIASAPRPPRLNESLTPGAVAFMRACNRLELRPSVLRQIGALAAAMPEAFRRTP